VNGENTNVLVKGGNVVGSHQTCLHQRRRPTQKTSTREGKDTHSTFERWFSCQGVRHAKALDSVTKKVWPAGTL
jgi:hypothetical protein